MRDEIRSVLFRESTIMSRLDEMAQQISSDYEGKDLTVVAVLNGSLMFGADLLRRMEMPLRLDCLSVSSYHGASTTGVVKFNQEHLPDVHGRHVLLLDDILDSGHTLHAIRDRLQNETSPLSIKICVLLRKDVPRQRELEADYVGFDIANEFVVGYGLDYMERFRNLPYVGVINDAAIAKYAPKA
ncbi:MAG: hypoxanthine phosphoribosyltransferase [Chthoniobacterales bacterium]|nr:hypoxanthine phosphoribosyltransferase [Chthoniobacterales bacterium]